MPQDDRRLFNALAAKQCPDVPKTVDDSQNFHTVREWQVKDERLLETFNAEHPQPIERGTFHAPRPTHVQLGCEQRESLVRSGEKSMPDLRCRFDRVVERLSVKIAVRSRPDQVARPVQLVRNRSSSKRCFSSQYAGPASIGWPEFKPSKA